MTDQQWIVTEEQIEDFCLHVDEIRVAHEDGNYDEMLTCMELLDGVLQTALPEDHPLRRDFTPPVPEDTRHTDQDDIVRLPPGGYFVKYHLKLPGNIFRRLCTRRMRDIPHIADIVEVWDDDELETIKCVVVSTDMYPHRKDMVVDITVETTED